MRLKESVRIDSETYYHFVPKKRNRQTFWNGNYRKITKTHTQTNISIIFNTLASNSWSSNVMRSDYLKPPRRSQNAHCYSCRTNHQLYVVVWLGSRIIPFISLPFIYNIIHSMGYEKPHIHHTLHTCHVLLSNDLRYLQTLCPMAQIITKFP
jgi:hypothetical protein